MESGIDNKQLKVVWICHFVNQKLKDIFKRPDIDEFAPWIDLLIELFEKREDIELHLVSPNRFLNENIDFKINKIQYHLFDTTIPLVPKKIGSFLRLNYLFDFYFNKYRVKKIIDKINPDIIHLHGTENTYYSVTVIPLIKNYPVMVTIQGFAMFSSPIKQKIIRKKAITVETELLRKAKYFGIRAEFMMKLIKEINSQSKFCWHNYPIKHPSFIKKQDGTDEFIDCIFFARVHKDKGIEDLLQAIAIVKKELSNVTLKIIGSCDKDYLNFLLALIKKLNIVENVEILGFLPKQNNIYKYANNAKICVLPTYHDIIPGTIIESMFIKLPVIAYNVGGIPEINKNSECICLVKKGNIKELSKKILLLLNNNQLRISLSNNAYNYALQTYINSKIPGELINFYKQITHENNTI